MRIEEKRRKTYLEAGPARDHGTGGRVRGHALVDALVGTLRPRVVHAGKVQRTVGQQRPARNRNKPLR